MKTMTLIKRFLFSLAKIRGSSSFSAPKTKPGANKTNSSAYQ
jgi:hypothetical protein